MAGYDRTTPEGRRFFEQIEKLKQLEVRVGFNSSGGGNDENHNRIGQEPELAEIAMWNELGTVNSPARPFMRQSVDDNKSTINTFCRTQLQALTEGKTAKDILKMVGALQVGLVKDKIRNGSFEPNAESTIKKKKSEKPLIDNADMRQSVNYVIQRKGG